MANDLNPFSPLAFPFIQGAATTGSMFSFNQALSYGASQGLTYPNKSSVFSGIMSTSETFAKFADAIPVVAVGVAAGQAIYTEFTAQCQWP